MFEIYGPVKAYYVVYTCVLFYIGGLEDNMYYPNRATRASVEGTQKSGHDFSNQLETTCMHTYMYMSLMI